MQPNRALCPLVMVAALVVGGWSPPPVAAALPAPPTRSAPSPPRSSDGTGQGSAPQRAAEARAAAAAQQARAAAAAARRAAQLAAAGQRVRATWVARARPARMVIVRDDTLDIVTQGRLTRRTPRRIGPLTLTTMSRYLPRSWLTIDGGTAVFSAAVVLTPRVVLDIGGDVGTVRLTGGATLPRGGRDLHRQRADPAARRHDHVTDPATGQPLAASTRPAVHRGDDRRPARRHRRDGDRPRHGGRRARPAPRRSSSTPTPPAPWSVLTFTRNRRAPAARITGRPHRGRHRHRLARPTAWTCRDRGTHREPDARRAQRRRRHQPQQHDHGAPDHRDHHGRQRPVRARGDPAAGTPASRTCAPTATPRAGWS